MTHGTMPDALLLLLEEELRLLRAGAFADLPALVAQKEKLLAALSPLAPQNTPKLKELALRNQRALKASLEGVRAAQRRLRAIGTAAQGFTSYDTRGKLQAISAECRSIEKRA